MKYRKIIMVASILISFVVGIQTSYFGMNLKARQGIIERFPGAILCNVQINRGLEMEDFYDIPVDITHDELMSRFGWPNATCGSGIVSTIYVVEEGYVEITWLGRPIITLYTLEGEEINIPAIESGK